MLTAATLWALLVFCRYFTSPSHPLGRALPAVWGVFQAGFLGSSSAASFWRIQGESFLILLTAFGVAGGTWAIGRNLRQWFQLDLGDSWVRAAFDFGLGTCFLDLFWIGTGLERIWFKPLWIIALTGAILLFVKEIYGVRDKGKAGLVPVQVPQEAAYLFLGFTGLFYWLFSLLQDLSPEGFYDSMVYHLAVPSYWLLHHGLRDFPTNFFANYPYGAECFFLNGFALQGTESAKMLHLVSFGASALVAGGWAREMSNEKSGRLVLGLILTFPLFAITTWTTQVEGFLTLAVLLFVYSLCRFASGVHNSLNWAMTTGLFAGLAVSTKYTAIMAVGTAVFTVIFIKELRPRGRTIKTWALPVLGFSVMLGPWVLKNLAYTGNPFFPYGMEMFPGRHLPPAGYAQLLQEQHARITTDGWSWLLLPWTLTMSNPDSYNFAGPLALALTPFLLLFRLRQPALKFLAALTPLLFAEGLAVTHILRFNLPVFVFLYILSGVLLAGGEKPFAGRMSAWVAGLSAILCFAYLAAIGEFYYASAGIWLGRQTRADYLASPGKITPYTPMAGWISRQLPLEAHLLIVGDARGLYYERPFLTNSVFDDQLLARAAKEEKDAEGIARRLREWGVDYLAVNGSEGVRVSADYHHYDLTTEEWRRLDDFIQRGTEQVYFQNFQGVYRLLPVLQKGTSSEKIDLALFFSKPATGFLKSLRAQKWEEAGDDLTETLRLYPFSRTWKVQGEEFEKKTGIKLHV
ncbi:MAG TPA: glycosyltransferase family 39 protein [bacterium]|nr:glycosyltransferase family 39 protein [bacterium]